METLYRLSYWGAATVEIYPRGNEIDHTRTTRAPNSPAHVRRQNAGCSSPPSALQAETIRCISRLVNEPSTGSASVSSAARSVSGSRDDCAGTRASGAPAPAPAPGSRLPWPAGPERRHHGRDARCPAPAPRTADRYARRTSRGAHTPQPSRSRNAAWRSPLRDLVVRRLGPACCNTSSAVPLPELAQPPPVGRPPEAVYDNDGRGPRSYGRLDRGRVKAVTSTGSMSAKTGSAPAMTHGLGHFDVRRRPARRPRHRLRRRRP